MRAYRSEATRYDERTEAFSLWRELLIRELPAKPGQTVLDVGCGTGLCFSLLRQKVGPTGTVIGVDTSQDMRNIAAGRIVREGWDNVSVLSSTADEAAADVVADAVIFCAVHDAMQSAEALRDIFSRVEGGAPVAAIGGKWPPSWMWPLRAWVAELHRPFIADFAGFDRPWQLLAEFVPDLEVRELAFGAGYLALGHAGK